MSLPTVSVIIPVYNRANTIAACLDSIASQTRPPDEIVVVDDGSTDGSAEIVEQWRVAQSAKPFTLLVIRQANQGKSAALNAGFAKASGDWIAFNDSDDLWLQQKLEKQMELLGRHPSAQVCFSDSRFVNDPSLTETNFQIRGFDEKFLKSGLLVNPHQTLASNPNGIFMQTIVAHRECARQVFPLDPSLRVAQDIDLLFRLSLTSDFCFSREVLVEIDRTPDRGIGLTKEHDMKSLYRLQTKEKIIQGWLAEEHERRLEVATALQRNLANVQKRIAATLRQQGSKREARAYYRSAFSNHRSPANLARLLINGML